MSKSVIAAAILSLSLVACSVGGADTDRAGNPVDPVVVTIGTEDIGVAATALLTLLADRVATISDGRVEVQVDSGIIGGGTAWDQAAIERVRRGDFDGVLARAGAWHSSGVTTLDVLQLPGVIDTDAQADRVVLDDRLVGELLAGLDGSGFTGLGLYPEAPRYLMLLDGSSDFSQRSLAGRAVRVPLSETLFDVLTAMGLRPVDVAPDDFVEEVATERVTATDGQLARVPLTVTSSGDNRVALAIGMPLYTKFLVLAMRDGAVPADVLDVLRHAARDVITEFLATRSREEAAVGEACAVGASLIEMPAEERAALLQAAAPVISAVSASDGGTLLADVRAAGGVAEPPALGCDSASTTSESTAAGLRTRTDHSTSEPHDVREGVRCARSGCPARASRTQEQR